VGKFPTTFLETFLTGLTTIFEYEEAVKAETFSEFVRWLVTFHKTTKDNDTVQILLVRMLTMLLNHNSPLHLHAGWTVCVKVPHSDGEHLRPARDRFRGRIPRRKRVLLCIILLHLRYDHPISRQAAHKPMCLMVSRQRSVFTLEVPTALMMLLTSHSPAGHITEAGRFIRFVSQSITADLIGQMFAAFRSGPEVGAAAAAATTFVPCCACWRGELPSRAGGGPPAAPTIISVNSTGCSSRT
jgi:hypothetical protein